ncbi:MAG: aminoglycoside 6'-N-acetyltransferase [Acidobacteriota bacterium]
MMIRPLQESDKSEWLRLRHRLWPDASLDELAAEVNDYQGEDAKTIVLVCERESGGLQGMLEVSIRAYAEGCNTNHVGYLEGWYVDVDVRRQGVGRALVEAAENWAIAQGCTEMASDTEIDNLLSQKAHAQIGYAEVERIVCFKKDLKRE